MTAAWPTPPSAGPASRLARHRPKVVSEKNWQSEKELAWPAGVPMCSKGEGSPMRAPLALTDFSQQQTCLSTAVTAEMCHLDAWPE